MEDTPPRRILSLWLAHFAIDRWRLDPAGGGGCARGEGADAAPTALIVDTAHGPRITAVNAVAHAGGARPEMMLADARTLCPPLRAVPADPAGDRAALETLAEWSMRWGPWSALDPPDGVLVDVTAVAHLFGGEAALLAEAHRACDRRGLTVRAAIAPTAGAAWALAHHGPPGSIVGPRDDLARRLADLPVAALRLEADVLTVLRRLGLKRLGDLTRIADGQGGAGAQGIAGRDAIMRRFRNRRSAAANPLIRLDQLLGRVPEPLLPVVPHAMPLVQRRLAEPVRHREPLDHVLADLAADLVRALEGRGEGARRLELGLWRVDGEVLVRRLELADATRDAAHICYLFARKLDDIDAGFGIEIMRLRASWTEPLAQAQDDVEQAAQIHGTSLSACIDRLANRLGRAAIARPVPRGSHLPERAQSWQPPLDPEPPMQGAPAFHARPLKLLDRAEPIAVLYATPDGYPRRFRWRGAVHEIARVEGPERIAPEWWRARPGTRLRDYYRIEDAAGGRYWIYRAGLIGDGRGGPPEWFLHGLYA